MKILTLLLIALLISPLVRAEEIEPPEPDSFTTVTGEEIRRLEVMHWKGQRLIAVGNFRQAVDLYWEIILLEPDDDSAYTNLGNLYLILGDIARAKDAFQNAVHINPHNEDAAAGLFKIANPDSP